MPTYREVSDLYRQSGSQEDLPTWAAKMDQLRGGTSDFTQAAHDPLKIKAASVGIDRLLEMTGAPAAGEALGRSVGGAVGAPEAGAQIGKGLPRGFVNFAPLLIPGGGIPGAIAKYGATALLSGAGTYTETGSPAAGIISGATAAAMPPAARLAEQAALRFMGGRLVAGRTADVAGNVLKNYNEYFPKNIAQSAGAFGAGQVAAAGVGQAGTTAQEVATDQPITSPFSTENLLNLTLGQVPFAAMHLGGKLTGAIHSPEHRADLLQHAIDVSEPRIALREATENQRNMPDIAKIPDVEQPEVIPPAVLEERQNLLAASRRGQFAIAKDPNLTPEQKLEATNRELQFQSALITSMKTEKPPAGTVFGDTITKEEQRTELVGRQVYQNKAGTWRAVLVADDPSNPPELVGHVVGYSTRNEPAPTAQAQEIGQQTRQATFSLPHERWWSTPKPEYEWFKQTPTVEQTLQARRAKFVRLVDGTVSPVDPAAPLQPDGRVKLADGTLVGRDAITNTLDQNQQTLLTQVPEVPGVQPELPKQTVEGGIEGRGGLTAEGRDLVAATDAGHPLPDVMDDRLYKIALDNDVPGKLELKPADLVDALRLKGDIQPMTEAELTGYVTDLEKVKQMADTAQTPLDGQQAVVALHEVEARNDLPLTSDTNLRMLRDLLVNEYGMDPDKAAQAAVTATASWTQEAVKAKAAGVRDITEQTIGTVAATFGGEGFGTNTALKMLSKSKEPDIVSAPIDDMVAAEAQNAIKNAGIKTMNAFREIPNHTERKLAQDVHDWLDIINNFRADELPFEAVAKLLNERNEGVEWDANDVKEFVNLPHTKLWLSELNDIMARKGKINEEHMARGRIYPVGTTGSPWSDQQLQAVKGEPGYVPTVDLINWAKTQPGFAEQVARYKETTAKGGEPDAVAMEEIAHRLAFEANQSGVKEDLGGIPAGGGYVFGLKPPEQIQGMTKTGVMPETKFQNVGSYSGAFSKGEMQLMKMLVPEAFDKGQVNVTQLASGLKERGPILEVKKQKQGPVGGQSDRAYEAEQEGLRAQHELETAGFQAVEDNGWHLQTTAGESVNPEHVPQAIRDNYYRVVEAAAEGPGDFGSPPGSAQYAFVGPKSETQMPGYVEGLVRIPIDKSKILQNVDEQGRNRPSELRDKEAGVKYHGPHFGAEDTNVVAFWRGYEETLPDGTKALHVIEVQSDWGQTVQKRLSELKSGEVKLLAHNMFKVGDVTLPEEGLKRFGWKDTGLVGQELLDDVRKFVTAHLNEIAENPSKLGREFEGYSAGHPLLQAYESLALKSAIQHAKEVGATHVIVSDAETAMMTEGHDRYPVTELPAALVVGRISQADPNGDRAVATIVKNQSGKDVLRIETERGTSEELIQPGGVLSVHQLQGLFDPDEFRKMFPDVRPEQEKGMRLHYDQTLPAAMERLTKDKGQEVDLGLHKEVAKYTDQVPTQPTDIPLEGGMHLRGSPVFKDAEGNPKTNVTGRMYDVSQTPGEFTVMGRSMQNETNFTTAKNILEAAGYKVMRNDATGIYYVARTNGDPVAFLAGTPTAKLVDVIRQGPQDATPRWDRQPQYIPSTPYEKVLAQKIGVDPETGEGSGTELITYLQNHGDQYLKALGLDLAKFMDSAQRITVKFRDAGASYARTMPGNVMEIVIAKHWFGRSEITQGYTVAHELLHGLTSLELLKPRNAHVVEQLNQFRNDIIKKLPIRLKGAFDQLVQDDWYNRKAKGELNRDMIQHLDEKGYEINEDDSEVLYALLNVDETVAQGFASGQFVNFLNSLKAPEGNFMSRFVNIIKGMFGGAGKTEFDRFMSYSDQLLEQGNYTATFRNFTDRYFANLGQSAAQVANSSDVALALVGNSSITPLTKEDLFNQLRTSAFGPESRVAYQRMSNMFQARGDDFKTTTAILSEHGFGTGRVMNDVPTLLHNMFMDEVPKHEDVLATLPPDVTDYMFAVAKDFKAILSAVDAGINENNAGVLNIGRPEELRGPVAEALKGVEDVLKFEQVQREGQTMIDRMTGISPAGYYDSITNDPTILPSMVTDTTKPIGKDNALWTFFEPIGQWARRVPEIAEAVAKGWQLAANTRKMVTEAFKVFGTDLETMKLDKASIKLVERMLRIPKLTNAADDWIFTNQKLGKEADSVQMLESDHPEIQKILGPLSKLERDQVEELVQKHMMSQQQMQAQILEKSLQIGATYGSTVVGGPVKDGVQLTSTLLNALRVDRSDPNASAAADAQIQVVAGKMQPEKFNELFKYSMGVINEWNTLKEFYQKNPAWSSAQRYGKFLASFVASNGKSQVHGVESKKEADAMAKTNNWKFIKMEPNQRGQEDAPPNLGPDSVGMITKLREFKQNQLDILAASGKFTKEDLDLIRTTSPIEQVTTEAAYRGGVPRLQPQARGLTKGAEELPWLRNHFSWMTKTSSYWSRQLFRAQAFSHLVDPAIASNPEMQAKLKTHYDNMLVPDTQVGHFMQRLATNWFMGFNPASAIVNATQPFLTHVSEFTAMTGKPVDSYRRVIGGLQEVVEFGRTGQWKSPDHEWLIHQATLDAERSLSMYDDEAAAQEAVSTNLKEVMDGQRTRTLGQQLGKVWNMYTKVGMMMFKGVERVNNDIALLASFDYYRESEPNLSRDEAKEKAYLFNHAVNFGGGPAQRPVTPFSGRGPTPRTAAMLATSMQSYVLGTTSQLARYIQKGFFRPTGLVPSEVYAARKAAVQMLAIQLASAGVLGLPFVSGAVALLDKAFPDMEVNKHLREWMSELMGGDSENGHVLQDIAMTGMPSMFGWDMQSRLSMGNTLPGVSEVNGFDPIQLAGPPVNLVSNFIQGGQKLSQLDISGADKLMPSALKKMFQLGRSRGQVLDYANRPIFSPTKGEMLGIGLGFQPKRLSDFNAAQRIAKQAQDNVTRNQSQENQSMANEVLKGNFGTVQAELRKKIAEDKSFDPRAAIGAIATAAEALTFPRDLRREGTQKASDVRTKLLSTFNLPATLPDETRRLRFRQQIETRLGLPVSTGSAQVLAQVMDQLRRQNPEASRSELRRQSELLLRGRRPQTVALQQE